MLYGGAMINSGSLNLSVETTAGKAYGLRGTNTTEEWENSGTITANVTAHGGSVDGFSETSKYSNYANAVSISTSGIAKFTNTGTMHLTAVNYGKNSYYEHAIDIELECSYTSSLNNSGTINIQALEGYTDGIYLGTNSGDAVMTNSGNIDIVATTSGHLLEGYDDYALATGIEIDLANSYNHTPYQTALKLESGSSLTVSAAAAENVENTDEVTAKLCQAIQLQKAYFGQNPNYVDAPQEITLADDLVLVEGGEPFTVFFEENVEYYGLSYFYINSIGIDPEGEEPAKTVIILPALTGEVTITGTTKARQTLTAETSGFPENVPVTYQWQSCNTADGEFTDIDGATDPTYTLTNNDVGKYIRVIVVPEAGHGYGGILLATTQNAVAKKSSGGGTTTPTYPPTVERPDEGGGKPTVSPSSPEKGDKVTITPKPDEGCEVDTVTVTDKNGKNVKVTDNGDGTYRFTQPDGKVTISVTYREIDTSCDGGRSCPSRTFTDLSTTAWFHETVDYVLTNGLMSGTGANAFAPDTTLSRGMVAQILYNMEGGAGTFAPTYPDVSSSDWYANAVSWVSAHGVMSGYGSGLFGAEDAVTREQLAVTLYQYAKVKGYDVSASVELTSFVDGHMTSDWAKPAMQWAVAHGLFSGKSGNRLDPQGTATRAEVASILMNFAENIAK